MRRIGLNNDNGKNFYYNTYGYYNYIQHIIKKMSSFNGYNVEIYNTK